MITKEALIVIGLDAGAYHTQCEVEDCLRYMDQKQKEALPFVGSFVAAELPKPGARVKVIKGSVIRTTNSKHLKKECAWDYAVKLHSVHHGYLFLGEQTAPEVCWVGTGCYWHYTPVTSIKVEVDGQWVPWLELAEKSTGTYKCR